MRNLKKVIKGFEISYEGVGEQANKGFRYLNPFTTFVNLRAALDDVDPLVDARPRSPPGP